MECVMQTDVIEPEKAGNTFTNTEEDVHSRARTRVSRACTRCRTRVSNADRARAKC